LSYKFKYGFFTGAEGNLRVEDGEKLTGIQLIILLPMVKLPVHFDFFYKVRNRYESVVDRTTFCLTCIQKTAAKAAGNIPIK
jgi:hypothetical protein